MWEQFSLEIKIILLEQILPEPEEDTILNQRKTRHV